jgi:cytidine deaminase
MRKVDLKIFVEIHDRSELSPAYRKLVEEAEEATHSSYSPYSHFCVGAAIQLQDGTVVRGSNQENAAYPSGLCAERTAAFSAATAHPGKRMEAIAIVARPEGAGVYVPVSPCGACRQVLLEYEYKQGTPIQVLMGGPDDQIYLMPSVATLLPVEFTADQLKR